MQVCTSLQTDNHASTPPLFFTGRMPFLPPNQQRQSTEGTFLPTRWRQKLTDIDMKQNYVTVTLCRPISQQRLDNLREI